jgi:pectin methylesterase-like acyl-CoA thioesterase
MKFPFKKIPFPYILALAVLAALTLTTPAFAEGESPPTEPVAVEPADTPPAETQPEEVQPVDPAPAEPVEAEAVEALPVEAETAAQPVVEAPVEAPVEVCAGDGSADPYFYDASHTKHGGYGTIQAAVDDFVTLKGTGFIYVEFGTYNAEPSNMVQVYGVNKLTGIVFTDYYASERAPGDSFDPYDSSTWPTVNAMIDIEDQTSGFTLLGLRIAG